MLPLPIEGPFRRKPRNWLKLIIEGALYYALYWYIIESIFSD